jgi:signal transduction histidine kinase
MMQRLFFRTWFVVFLCGVIGVILGVSSAILLLQPTNETRQSLLNVAISAAILATEAPAGKLSTRLTEVEQAFALHARVVDVDGSVLVDSPSAATSDAFVVAAERVLADGRKVQVTRSELRPPIYVAVVSLLFVFTGMGIATYPIVRRLMARLQRLQHAVESFGAGNLSTRIKIEGDDEVASLARSFNASAERVDELVSAQRRLLANASHELRSPLARVRMAVELVAQRAQLAASDPLICEISTSIGELDTLIEELLVGSVLQNNTRPLDFRTVNLGEIVVEECDRRNFHAGDVETVELTGEATLLRRLVRNLIDNAVKYGQQSPITVSLMQTSERIVLTVADLGIGVPAEERERIFEAFYRRKGASEQLGGVGLGLSLVKQIAQVHGGDAMCFGNSPRGSRFVVTLAATAVTTNSSTR